MKNILLVEDDKLLSKTLEAVLKEGGYEVVLAKDADEALKTLKEIEIDLVYLDIMLPGGRDGFAILRQIKLSDSPYRDIPVIMLSNLGQMDEMNKAMEMGALDYVIKANIDLEQLVELTKKKIGNS